MANPEHVEILKQGVDVWNKWRKENPDIKPNLSNSDLSSLDLERINFSNITLFGANLSGTNLYKADLISALVDKAFLGGANLNEANLEKASLINADIFHTKLVGAYLYRANLYRAYLRGADLYRAYLHGADLRGASFRETNLRMADLSDTNLTGSDFSESDLSSADLSYSVLNNAILVKTVLENTILTGCSIHGISVWGLQLENAEQSDLIITDENEPIITVDNIEVAQFIYLLLNNKEVHNVIDTITSKVVLILGRFPSERKYVLDLLRDELRSHNYSPVIFDSKEYSCVSFIETARVLANMAHFVLVDLTNLDDRAHEIATSLIPRCIIPIQPFLLGNHHYNHTLFRELQQKYRWVLSPHRYRDISDLLESFQKQIIQPAEEKIIELKQREPLKIFLGYAHEDKEMLDTLKKHLKPLERSGQIEMWDDRDVEPGNTKNEEIEKQLSDARIILLLMSPDFIASNDCYVIQERAMELYGQGNAKVIPILLRSCAWKSTPLGQLQVLPRDEKPMKEHNPDSIFFEVSEEISDVIKEMT